MPYINNVNDERSISPPRVNSSPLKQARRKKRFLVNQQQRCLQRLRGNGLFRKADNQLFKNEPRSTGRGMAAFQCQIGF